MNIISVIAAFFIFSSNGIDAVGGLRTKLPDNLKDADKQTRIAAGWFDYVSTAPKAATNEVVVCVGFVRVGDNFTGVYKINKVEEAAPKSAN